MEGDKRENSDDQKKKIDEIIKNPEEKRLERHASIEIGKRFRAGACKNCGSLGHVQKHCLEKPHLIGAKFTRNIVDESDVKDKSLLDSNLSWSAKRDPWRKSNTAPVYKRYRESFEAKEEAISAHDNADPNVLVTLHTTLGDILCEIYCAQVPKTAENYLGLSSQGYYNNTLFHRNVPGFVIQGGDPTGLGKGGNSIWGKEFDNEILDSLKHNSRGILAMANNGLNKNRSQFYITYKKLPHLDGLSTVFGKVVDGFEVLDRMEKTPTGNKDRPIQEIYLLHVTIHLTGLKKE